LVYDPLIQHQGESMVAMPLQVRYISMVETISDYQVLLAGGVGWGACEATQRHNTKPIVTNVKSIDGAFALERD